MYLEDHPRTCKWLITMVIVSPLNRVIPLINGLIGLEIGGDPNHLLTGMILQVCAGVDQLSTNSKCMVILGIFPDFSALFGLVK